MCYAINVAPAEAARIAARAGRQLLLAIADLNYPDPPRWTSVFAEHTITSQLMPSFGTRLPMVYLREMEAKMLELQARLGWLSGSLSTDLCFWLPDDLLANGLYQLFTQRKVAE